MTLPNRALLRVLVGLAVASSVHTAIGQAAFPAKLDIYLTKVVKVTAAERKTLLGGAPLVKLQDADPAQEVAVFGAIWIAAPIPRYIAAVEDIEHFEIGDGFRATRKIGNPARVEDFADLAVPDDDMQDLRSCKVGDCQLKLSESAMERITGQIDWNRPDAKAQLEALLRIMAVDYVNAYREGGNVKLAVYRDEDRPTFVANEFRELLDGMPEFASGLPDMRQYLLDYPKPPTRPTSSFLYWQEAEFGLKPTIRINHVAIQEGPDATVVASKQIYSSHYFWTALELRVLFPDPTRGPGFWFVNVNRSRSDGLSGFTGRIIRGRVRDGARHGTEAALVATKKALETR